MNHEIGTTFQKWASLNPGDNVLVLKETEPSPVPYLHRVGPDRWRWHRKPDATQAELADCDYFTSTFKSCLSVAASSVQVVKVKERAPEVPEFKVGDRVRGVGVNTGRIRRGTLIHDGQGAIGVEPTVQLDGTTGAAGQVRVLASTLELVEAPVQDLVNTPAHYADRVPGIECIQVTSHFNFNRGNAIKYVWRAGEKGDAAKEIEDLNKARKYLDFEIQRLGGEVK